MRAFASGNGRGIRRANDQPFPLAPTSEAFLLVPACAVAGAGVPLMLNNFSIIMRSAIRSQRLSALASDTWYRSDKKAAGHSCRIGPLATNVAAVTVTERLELQQLLARHGPRSLANRMVSSASGASAAA